MVVARLILFWFAFVYLILYLFLFSREGSFLEKTQSMQTYDQIAIGKLEIYFSPKITEYPHVCTGTLIAPRIVLSAGHCFQRKVKNIGDAENRDVFYINTYGDGNDGESIFVKKKIIAYIGFHKIIKARYIDDIGVALLEEEFSKDIRSSDLYEIEVIPYKTRVQYEIENKIESMEKTLGLSIDKDTCKKKNSEIKDDFERVLSYRKHIKTEIRKSRNLYSDKYASSNPSCFSKNYRKAKNATGKELKDDLDFFDKNETSTTRMNCRQMIKDYSLMQDYWLSMHECVSPEDHKYEKVVFDSSKVNEVSVIGFGKDCLGNITDGVSSERRKVDFIWKYNQFTQYICDGDSGGPVIRKDTKKIFAIVSERIDSKEDAAKVDSFQVINKELNDQIQEQIKAWIK